MFIPKVEDTVDLLSNKSKAKQKEIADSLGLVDRRRVIHIFHDETNPKFCKVIHINISVTRGDGVKFDREFRNRYNGALSFIGVYVYDCELNITAQTLMEKFKYGNLKILSARRMDRSTDFDNNDTVAGINLFSDIYRNHVYSDFVDCTKPLVNPRYYTLEHEYACTGDFNVNGIVDDIYVERLIGEDIIDDVTEIYRQNPNKFETIRDALMLRDEQKLHNIDYANPMSSGALDMLDELNRIHSCNSLVNGGVFTYDSQLGMNFKDSTILCKSYITPQDAVNEMQSMINSISAVSKMIERDFGSIRVFFSPSLLGSKCRVIYKDYKDPKLKYSDGNISGTNVKASRDNSHEVAEVVSYNIDEDLMIHRGLSDVDGVRDDSIDRARLISRYYMD